MPSPPRCAHALAALACAFVVALVPASAHADPETDRRIGTGLAVGAILPVATGAGLLFGASDVEDERLRVRLFASGVPTLVAGFAMFGTGVGFLGRSNATRRAEPWGLGRGAAAGYLSMGALGLGMVALGSYARILIEPGPRRANRLRGLGLAGLIVGGNLAVFGTFLGAYTLGQASATAPTMRMLERGAMLGWSGRF